MRRTWKIYLPTSVSLRARKKRKLQQKLVRIFRGFEIAIAISGFVTGISALVFSAKSIDIANNQSIVAVAALREQQIGTAWQILSSQNPARGSKRYAMTVLLNYEANPLTQLRFGCDDLSQSDLFESEYVGCANAIDLSGVAWLMENRSGISVGREILRSSFAGGSFVNSTIERIGFQTTDLSGAHFGGATVRQTIFYSSKLDGIKDFFPAGSHIGELITLDNVLLSFSSMTGSSLTLEGRSIDFNWVDLRDTTLKGKIDTVYFGRVSLARANLVDLQMKISNNPTTAFWFQNTVPDFGGAPIEISDAVFCERFGDGAKCMQGLTQAFFDRAWYKEGHPPIGLDRLPENFKLRPGCDHGDAGDNFEFGVLGWAPPIEIPTFSCFNSKTEYVSSLPELKEATKMNFDKPTSWEILGEFGSEVMEQWAEEYPESSPKD